MKGKIKHLKDLPVIAISKIFFFKKQLKKMNINI